MKAIKTLLLLIAVLFFSIQNQSLTAQEYDQGLYDALEYRLVGPFRGGRSAAVTGVPGKPNLYYFGAAGGGVWETKNG